MKLHIPLLYVLFFPAMAMAQSSNVTAKPSAGTTTAPVIVSTGSDPVIAINLDLNTTPTLPFDVPFKLTGGGGTNEKITVADLVSVDCWYIAKAGETKLPSTDCAAIMEGWQPLKMWKNDGTSNLYWFDVPPLRPNTKYSFAFRYKRMLTQTERTALISFAQPLILPALNTKATSGAYQFSPDDIKTITGQLVTKMNTYLKTQYAIQIDPITIDAADYQQLFNAVSAIAFANDLARNARDQAKFDINTLQQVYDLIAKFMDNYRKTGKDADKTNNLKLLLSTQKAIMACYNLPTSDQAVDATSMKTFTDACDAIPVSINQVTLSTDAFKLLRSQVSDNAEGLSTKLKQYGDYLKKATSVTSDQLGSFIDAIAGTLGNQLTISGSNVAGDFVTRTNTYICADLGLALLPGLDKITPYLGTNIYFRPINTNAPLTFHDSDWVWRRTSLVIGVSVASISRSNIRSDLFSNSFNVITGAGLRITNWVRVSGGLLWYNKLDADPLNTNQRIARTGFVSVSFDLRIKTALNNLFTSSQTTP